MLGTIGLISFLLGGFWPGRIWPGNWVAGQYVSRLGTEAAAPAAGRDLFGGRAVAGGQLMSIGFLAEMITAYQHRDSDTYSIAERTPEHVDAEHPAEMNDSGETNARLRWSIYWLLIAAGGGHDAGPHPGGHSVDAIATSSRICTEQGRKDWQRQRPFLSANDRSRWCHVARWWSTAPTRSTTSWSEPGWDTIDMVKHSGATARSISIRASRRCCPR